MWKDFFYFTRTERQGIIVLVVLILGIFIISHFLSKSQEKNLSVGKATIFQKEYDSFIHSIQEVSSKEYLDNDYYDSFNNSSKPEPFPFDPNMADSSTLLKVGMYPWMVRNILRYRMKGGKFRQPEDLQKIYGMTHRLYNRLLPYICIQHREYKNDTTSLFAFNKIKKDTIYKYPMGTKIDLNHSDTTELKKIPGIGSGLSKMIVRYRKQLGNYYEVDQLKDIHLSAEKLKAWLTVKPHETIKININKCSLEKLMRHPYINFYQAKVIVEHRRKKGDIKSLKQLILYEEFTANDFQRLEPYICFN